MSDPSITPYFIQGDLNVERTLLIAAAVVAKIWCGIAPAAADGGMTEFDECLPVPAFAQVNEKRQIILATMRSHQYVQ